MPVILPKHMCHALGTGAPERVLEPEWNNSLNPTKDIKDVEYQEVRDQQQQIEHHLGFEHEDPERNAHD